MKYILPIIIMCVLLSSNTTAAEKETSSVEIRIRDYASERTSRTSETSDDNLIAATLVRTNNYIRLQIDRMAIPTAVCSLSISVSWEYHHTLTLSSWPTDMSYE